MQYSTKSFKVFIGFGGYFNFIFGSCEDFTVLHYGVVLDCLKRADYDLTRARGDSEFVAMAFELFFVDGVVGVAVETLSLQCFAYAAGERLGDKRVGVDSHRLRIVMQSTTDNMGNSFKKRAAKAGRNVIRRHKVVMAEGVLCRGFNVHALIKPWTIVLVLNAD